VELSLFRSSSEKSLHTLFDFIYVALGHPVLLTQMSKDRVLVKSVLVWEQGEGKKGTTYSLYFADIE
jgi:hypothetical protein